MNKQDAILSFLDLCESSPITDLVLLGDILDLWRRTNCEIFSLPVQYYRDGKKSMGFKNFTEAGKKENPQLDPTVMKVFKNQEILRRLGTMPFRVHYVIGNHDYYLLRLQERNRNLLPFPIVKTLRLSEGGSEYFFTHGYDMDVLTNYELVWDIAAYERIADRLCYMGNRTGAFFSFLYGQVEKIWAGGVPPEVMVWMRTPSRQIQKKAAARPAKGEIDERLTFTDLFGLSRAAYLMLGMKPDEILVYGHTHYPFISTENRVVNTGSWCDDCPENCAYPYLKIEGGKFSLEKFTKGKDRL